MAPSSMTLEHISRSNQETILCSTLVKNYPPLVRFWPWRRFSLSEYSNEPGELSQWLYHDDSTINIVLVIISIIIIVIILSSAKKAKVM